MANLKLKTFCIVTGASRGIGKETAIELARKVHPESSFHLISRDEEALKDTAAKITAAAGRDTEINCVSADLSTDDGVARANQEIFKNLGEISRFSHAILVLNAASIGDVTKYARDLDDINYLQDYCRLNLSGPIVLTSKFFQAFGHGLGSLRKTVVQVTSINAHRPVETLHTYCMVKAGRDMFFRVMALEEPDVRFMTYDPGIVDTVMCRQVFTSVNKSLGEIAKNFEKHNHLLTPQKCARVLVKALEDDQYDNGTTVSAYDELGVNVVYQQP